jgi:hypothetical protein
MIAVKLFILGIFVAAWLSSRKNHRALSITDIFVLALLIIYVPYFVANPSAQSSWHAIGFSNNTIFEADIGLSLMFSVGAISLFLNGQLTRRHPSERAFIRNPRREFRAGLAAIIVSVIILFTLLMVSEEFYNFRVIAFRFITGGLGSEDYHVARRLVFENVFVLDQVVGRLRFSIMPILFIFISSLFLRGGKMKLAALSGFLFFLMLPMSLSKLPFVYYIAYFTMFLFAYHGKINNIGLGRIVLMSIGSVLATLLLLAILYRFQYSGLEGYENIFDKPASLAFERFWGESYSVVLRYFEAYPDKLRFTGWSGIGLIATLFDLEFRNVNIEVPYYFFGFGATTSNPGLFILSGYAGFGYLGIIIYSFLTFILVFALEGLHKKIRSRLISATFFAVLAVNVTFLVQVPLPTALLTYGLGTIPIILLILDHYIAGAAIRRRGIGVPLRI